MFYLFVLAISLLPLISIFSTPDLPHTHDGLVHLPRMAAYFKVLADGQIPVRWVGDLNYGYGMPLFNFIYQLPYFISSIFIFAGASLVNSFKITLVLSYLLSGLFMFAFTKEFFGDNKKAFLVTIFYQFAPFRLVEVLIRGSFGEVYTYTFFPLVLLGLTLLFKKFKYHYFFLTSLATALLILSHNSVSFLFFAVSAAFILFFAPGKKGLLLGFSSLLLGLVLSSFYWIPAIFEHKYTYGDLFMRNLYLSHFPPIQNLFLPNFFNTQTFQVEGLSVQIGLFHTLALLFSIMILLLRRKIDSKTKKLFGFCFLVFALSLFFMQPISKIFWENLSFLRQFQFPWRFLSLISFVTSMLAVSFLSLSFFKKKWVYTIVLILVVISTVYYWRPPLGFDKVDEKYYWDFPLNTTYFGETDVIWSAGPAKSYPRERIELIGGEGKIDNVIKKSNSQTFTIQAKTDISLVSHTQYFPGWRVYVDEKSIPIQFQDPNWRGLITFNVPRGAHEVKIAFGETKLRLLADFVSVITLSLLSLIGIFKLRRIRI